MWIMLLKNMHQFIEESSAPQFIEKIHPDTVLDKIFSMSRHFETKALLKTNRPKNSGRIFNKREIMENSDALLLEILACREKIDQAAEFAGRE